MPEIFYEDPNGIRTVLYAHDPEAERALEAKDAEATERILDEAVGAGRIGLDERRNVPRLEALPGFTWDARKKTDS
jgi:hypothetical protein